MKILAILGLCLLSALCIYFNTPQIENDLRTRSTVAIVKANLPLPDLEFDGRDATLFGIVYTEAIKERIQTEVADVFGVRSVKNNLIIKTVEVPVESDENADQLQRALNTFVLNQKIEFSSGSASLTAASKVMLSEMAAFIKNHLPTRIEIIGHTDNTGETDHNLILSQKRAETVKKYLVDQGIEAQLLATIGHGSSLPLTNNTTALGRSKNRRVEFKVIKGK